MKRSTIAPILFATAAALLLTGPARADGAGLGGVVGVIRSTVDTIDPALFRMMTPVLKDAATKPIETERPFEGALDLWMDHADRRYAPGDMARVFLTAEHGAYVQLLTVAADGRAEWLYPADRLGLPSEPQRIEPGVTLALPRSSDAFYYRMDPPFGPAVLQVIASSAPLPADVRAAAARDLVEAGRSGGDPAIRAVLTGLAQRYPEWKMRTRSVVYEIAAAAPIAETPKPATPPPPTPTPASPTPASPTPASPTTPTPPTPIAALGWLTPGNSTQGRLAVQLDKPAYPTGGSVVVTVHAAAGCRLLVMALGAGGAVDLLYPNAVQPDPASAIPAQSPEIDLTLPKPGSELHLHTRGPATAEAQRERVVAMCWPGDGPMPITAAPSRASPTLTFLPGSTELAALEALRDQAAGLVSAEAAYTVAGPAAQ